LEVLPLDLRTEPDGVSVASGILRAYDTRLGTALVAAVARRTGLALGDRRASRALELARRGRTGARLDLGGGWIAEAGFGRLALVRPVLRVALSARLTGRQGELGVGPWRVRWSPDPAPPLLVRDATATWVIPGEYQVRSWRPGDRIRPLGGRGRRLVVRCMQDRQVPRRSRSGWPLLESEDVIVWVPGVCRSDALVPEAGTEATRIDVEQA
jgi:tRNA(Ile)-lysidine synthetase-like protein